MCKQFSTQEELIARDEMKGVPVTADKLLYLHAIELCLSAASLEFFGKAEEVSESVRPLCFCSSLPSSFVVYWTVYGSSNFVS